MKNIIVKIISWCARRVLQLNKPIVIAITGSVGKSSTKDAIAVVLGSKFNVRAAKKNLNTEIGVPLTILDEPNAGNSVIGWMALLARGFIKAIRKQSGYPTHLILEFGADKPGDIKHLVELAKPKVGVMTRMSRVHVENYPSFDALLKEKAELVKGLPKNGLAVLNGDDTPILEMRSQVPCAATTYGFGPDAEIDGRDYVLETREDDSFDEDYLVLARVRFTIHDRLDDESAKVVLRNTIGIHQAYNCLAAAAVGKYFGMSLAEVVDALKEYESQPGRLKPLRGIKGSLLLDDSYNAAPASTKAALDVLGAYHPVEGARRIAVIGTNAELGQSSEEEHRQIGWKAAEIGVDLLVPVGEMARDIGRGAIEAGMAEENVKYQINSEKAGRFMDREVKKGDIVLIKGSQSARMEKVVKDLLADPMRAPELLVRQEREWQNR